MEKFEVLTDEQLSAVVAAGNVHTELRRRLGMCGCGVEHVHVTA